MRRFRSMGVRKKNYLGINMGRKCLELRKITVNLILLRCKERVVMG